jgi:pimeloyl-ACP methyl ester carboxylesterase
MPLQIVRRLLPDWGTTYGPPGDGPFPAVMVLHGSEGGWSGWSHQTATLLAAHGFLAFPMPYARGGNAWNAGSIIDVPLDRTVQALEALRAFSFADKVGLFGVSRGAEHGLLVSSLMAQDGLPVPDALAVHAPADVVCGAFDAARWRDRGDPGWQSWDPALRAWTWRGSSESLLPSTPIAVDRITCPMFISHGVNDEVWSVEMAHRIEARLRAAGRSPQMHIVESEGHLFRSEAQNELNAALIDFFERQLFR